MQRDAHPVLWSEGIFLGPQHFQQELRARQAEAGLLAQALCPLGWGFLRLEIDRGALAAGSLALTRIEAVLPDGAALSLDDPEDLPRPRALADAFTEGITAVRVHLGLPWALPGQIAVADGGEHEGRPTRWRRRLVEVPDHSGGPGREIALMAPHLRLLLDGERDGYASLPVALVQRTAADRLELDPGFAPPCLRLDASPALLMPLRRLVSLLSARAVELAEHRRMRSLGLVEFAASDVANALLMLAIGRHLPGLRGDLEAGWPHPERVHGRLAALAGELAVLAGGPGVPAIPAYAHDSAGRVFAELEELLTAQLQTVIPTRYIPIPVRQAADRLHAGTIPDQATEGARFYLAVHSTLPAERVLRDVPTRAKVASHGRIDALTAQAMPGMRLGYVPVPPPEIPAQPGAVYFLIDPQGAEWQQALATRTIAAFLPPELAEARVEFLAVKG